MRHLKVDQNTPEWWEARKGMISGSNIIEVMSTRAGTKKEMMAVLDDLKVDYDKKLKVGDIERLLPETEAVKLMLVGEKKIGFYQLVAERIAIESDFQDETPMDRGHRLEQESLDIYQMKTGNKVDRVGIFVSNFSDKVGNSPDGATKVGKKYPIAQETKSLSTAKHLKAFDEQKIPDEYESQKIQYFVANNDLKQLDFMFYDDRIPEEFKCRHFVITIYREEIEKEIRKYRIYEKMLLEGVDELVEKLTF